MVLHRRTKTPRLIWRERLALMVLTRWVPTWKQVLQIIEPDTLLRWHRKGYQPFWRWKSRGSVQTKPQRVSAAKIALIERAVRENPLCGAARIRGELLKLNISVAKRTIQKYMRAVRSHGLDRSRPLDSFLSEVQSRYTFLGERAANDNGRRAQKPKTRAERRLATFSALSVSA